MFEIYSFFFHSDFILLYYCMVITNCYCCCFRIGNFNLLLSIPPKMISQTIHEYYVCEFELQSNNFILLSPKMLQLNTNDTRITLQNKQKKIEKRFKAMQMKIRQIEKSMSQFDESQFFGYTFGSQTSKNNQKNVEKKIFGTSNLPDISRSKCYSCRSIF